MNYSEICARMPRELRSRLQAETVYAPWLRQGALLEDIWVDRVVMETVYNRMKSEERIVLESIVRAIGCEPFDDVKLDKSAGGLLSGAEIRAGLAGLLRKGLIFSFRKTWGEPVYLLPEDGFGLWRQLLFPDACISFSDSVTLTSIEPIEVVKADIRRGLFQSLVFAAQQGLKLTQNGTMHRKQLQKWSELIPLNESLLQGTPIKYAYADVYPMKAAVMLDILLRLQLVVPDGERLKLQAGALKSWLDRSVSEQHLVLYGLWKQLTMPTEAWLQHAVSVLEGAGSESWIPLNGLLTWLDSKGLLSNSNDSEKNEQRIGRLQKEWLDPLAALGWLEKGMDPLNGNTFYRWRMNPSDPNQVQQDHLKEDGQIMVQPDFDILVPPDVPEAVCWELCCMSDPVALDQVSIYKLSKTSVRRALENGRSAEEMVNFLEAHALYGVPFHIRLAISEWAMPFGKTSFASTLLLRCDDEETAAIIAKLPQTGKYIREAIGAKDFIVAESDLQPLAAALEKAGYMPELPCMPTGKNGSGQGNAYPKLTEIKPIEDAEVSFMERGLIYSRNSAHLYQLESRLPETADLYPDLKDIPPMWLRDYRTYHASTRKEMVEKAIEMKTLLQIRLNGTDYRIAPRKVQNTRGTWCMMGVGNSGERLPQAVEVRWLADEWDEMKLILPGINDKY